MKKALLAIAAALMVAIGVVAVVGVGAQEATPTPSPSPSTAAEKPLDSYVAKLATELGVSEEDLRTAMVNANLSLVDDAVADGKITAERGDQIKQRIQEEGIVFPAPLHRDGLRHHAAMFIGKAAAEVLDMEPEALVDELRSGKSLAEVAESKGMSVDDFKSALLEQVRSDLDAKVADGTITQERADAAYQRLSDNIDDVVNFHGGEGLPCHRGGPGPFGGIEDSSESTDIQ